MTKKYAVKAKTKNLKTIASVLPLKKLAVVVSLAWVKQNP